MPVIETAELVSADGTRLRYRTVGEGPPLIIAHGSFGTSDDHVPVALRLAAGHRVALLDRRGYRDSEVGPGPASFAQDGEDLLALARLLGPGCAVFGHSAGALGALHAARAEPGRLRAMVLWEPPILLGGPGTQPLLDLYRQRREAGEDGAALVAFLSATTPVPRDVVSRWIENPALSPRLAAVASGVGRDLEAAVALAPEFEAWRDVAVPVTLLLGAGTRPDPMAGSVHGLDAVLLRSRVITIPGPEHIAHILTPDLIAETTRTASRD